MFENIGGKIKGLASAICGIGMIISCLIGLGMIISDDDMILYGIIIAVIGCFFSWIGSFLLYGYGQLIENSDKLVQLAKRPMVPTAVAPVAPAQQVYAAPVQQAVNPISSDGKAYQLRDLNQRYANGEISMEEYQRRVQALQ